MKSSVYRSHALRGNAAGEALRHASLERYRIHSHAERGNDVKRTRYTKKTSRINPISGDAISRDESLALLRKLHHAHLCLALHPQENNKLIHLDLVPY